MKPYLVGVRTQNIIVAASSYDDADDIAKEQVQGPVSQTYRRCKVEGLRQIAADRFSAIVSVKTYAKPGKPTLSKGSAFAIDHEATTK